MWVQRSEYLNLVRAHAQSEWMRLRINQLEAERAVLLAKTGIVTDVPVIRSIGVGVPNDGPAVPIERTTPEEVLAGLSGLFDDMGDDAASKAGIGHDDKGILSFR